MSSKGGIEPFRLAQLEPELLAVSYEESTGESRIIVNTDQPSKAIARAALRQARTRLLVLLPGLQVVADLLRRWPGGEVGVATTGAAVLAAAGGGMTMAFEPFHGPASLPIQPQTTQVRDLAPLSRVVRDRADPVPSSPKRQPRDDYLGRLRSPEPALAPTGEATEAGAKTAAPSLSPSTIPTLNVKSPTLTPPPPPAPSPSSSPSAQPSVQPLPLINGTLPLVSDLLD